MKLPPVLILCLFILIAVVPVLAQEEIVTASEKTTTATKITTVPTVIPTATPTGIQDAIEKVKPVKWKDTTAKIRGNKLVFETAVQQKVVIRDADDVNSTVLVQTVVNNQIDLPVDISKPGKISIKMQVGDVVYVIRRIA
jgi:hypothetical protein